MKAEFASTMEDFLKDFNYSALQGYEAFSNSFPSGKKLVILNCSSYQDGLMVEIQLAIQLQQVERVIFDFYKQYSNQLSLTYWETLSELNDQLPKRFFIQNRIELVKIQSEIENALVKKGFSWLDRLSSPHLLSEKVKEIIFSDNKKPKNLYKLCMRSYLLSILLGDTITEAGFYNYFEELQNQKTPDHLLEEFQEFNGYLKNLSLK